jgi:predicted membrane chloride channel (bestrophin family)
MITYNRSAFGLNLLLRVHGSAIYRSVIPGLFAIGCYLLIRLHFHHSRSGDQLGHPYVIGILVSSTTFLIVFRASQGYSRYWEATSCVYQMMSKWMDATSHTAVYHMQCDHYNKIKPPSFYDHPELNALFLTRDRERVRDIHSMDFTTAERAMHGKRAVQRSINLVNVPIVSSTRDRKQSLAKVVSAMSARDFAGDSVNPRPLMGLGRLDGNWGDLFDDGKSTYFDSRRPMAAFDDKKGFASSCGGRTPPLFLQELAHLSSLLTAVALSTLRNDVDGAESPLDIYEVGSPWPKVDPGEDESLWSGSLQKITHVFAYFLGVGRSPDERTLYNASRPLPVLGGVSDNEIRFLQMARGPSAKTQLCWAWLSEFIIREHLAGSLGTVGPPIVSRIIQFLGDGMIYYGHGRKIMYIPFPFVHAQLSAAFVLMMIPTIPFLMDQYTDDLWLGIVLSFFITMCLSGIHEVARELENPFRNVPNELPLVTLMAEFNEALVTMYAGYHPDFFWDYKRHETPDASLGSIGSFDEVDKDDSSTKSSAFDETTTSEPSELGEQQRHPEQEVKQERAMGGPLDESGEKKDEEVDRLRLIVQQQGKLMERMMEEQVRLNKLMEAALTGKDK